MNNVDRNLDKSLFYIQKKKKKKKIIVPIFA